MLKAVTWCAKCLFLYFLVSAVAVRFSWVFTTPVWQIADRMHWTHLSHLAYVLSYFLPIFAVAGFLIGLIPFGKLGKALSDLSRSLISSSAAPPPEPDSIPVPPILWSWAPVTLAFLIRFTTWQSSNASVFDAHHPQGRIERFFGPLGSQTPGLLDQRWVTDRFLFTGPMLFLMACALATLLRYRLTSPRQPQAQIEPDADSLP